MDRNKATYEAYDGVELRLLNGVVVRCAALTVEEAVRYLRLLSSIKEAVESEEEDVFAAVFVAAAAAHEDLVSGFPGRLGILGERLVDIGLEVEGPDGMLAFGDLTLEDALAMVHILGVALSDAYSAESSKAKVRILDELPPTLGVDGLGPAEVFALGRTFGKSLYLLIYDLAEDFCRHLTLSPRVKVMEMRAPLSLTQA